VEKEAGCKANHLPPTCAKLKNECNCTDTTPVRLPVADRDNFILPHRSSGYKSNPSYISWFSALIIFNGAVTMLHAV